MFKFLRRLLILSLLMSGTASYALANFDIDLERVEQLSWADPNKAVSRLNELQAAVTNSAELVQLLTVRGMVFVDQRRDDDVTKTLAQLQSLQSSDPSVVVASHLVRAYWFSQSRKLDGAMAELKLIDPDSLRTPLERYHVELMRAVIAYQAGQHETGLLANEKAMEIAQTMRSTARVVYASSKMVRFLVRTGNLDHAAVQLAEGRRLAEQTDDEAALVIIAMYEADIADRRGDHAGEHRASLEAVAHAKRVGSDQLLAYALGNLGGSYVKNGDYTAALDYSKQALVVGKSWRRNGFQGLVLFNMGLAKIGLGRLAEGKRDAERTIEDKLQAGYLVEAEMSLSRYADMLERVHDWHTAAEVYRRHEAITDKLMTQARQQALLELSGKFDSERKVRQIELLKRDNAIKDRDLNAQKMRQQMIAVIALLIGIVCTALAWAFFRIRKINQRLRYNGEHDTLTGLYNRRYFAEHILTQARHQSFAGCVVLIDLDHFKRVNDTLGHGAGDAVLASIAKRLANVLREQDTLVRWGGEEFLILFEPMTNAQLNSTVQRLLNAVSSQPVKWYASEIRCTASIGYARFPLAGTAFDVAVDRAVSLVDKALYHAKRSGRDRACLITQVTAHSERELTSINAEFEAATVDRRVWLEETTSEAA
jgi:diguanylate cyclase (GGDEF)-like protein